MRVLALSSSMRRGGQSITETLLDCLIRGMRGAGADVELVHLRDKDIGFCTGCLNCMSVTPGQCIQQDDMTRELFPKWYSAELVVYATPLYDHAASAPMKAFIERTLPIIEPYIDRDDDGRWTHPLRHRYPAAVVLSVCGFLEQSEFDGLSHYVNFAFHGEQRNLLAEIYRTSGHVLTFPPFKALLEDVLDATVKAGRELVESQEITPATLERIMQPLGDVESVKALANLYWRTCIAEGVTASEFDRRGLMLRPDSLETYMVLMRYGFDRYAAAGVEATLQFNFTGDPAGSCYFTVGGGEISTTLGVSASPDLIVDASFDVWMDIITGKADGAQMVLDGKYRIEGDIALLKLFSKSVGQYRQVQQKS